jgi:hypothetical protein
LCLAILAVSPGASHGQDPQAGEQVATEPAADEVFVFERHAFDGPMLRLKVGDELPDLRNTPSGNWDERISSVKVGADTMLIIYSWYRFSHVCLGLAGVNAGGSGRYSDLSRLKAANPIHLDDRARSLRVVAKGTDLRRLCR